LRAEAWVCEPARSNPHYETLTTITNFIIATSNPLKAMKETYGTLSETINALKIEGYTLDFNIDQECVICHEPKMAMSPNDFRIDGVFRFEGESNPDDQAILYAISSQKFNVKGVLVNGYGISAVDATDELIKKLNTPPETSVHDDTYYGKGL
jgi:hypothetical protein